MEWFWIWIASAAVCHDLEHNLGHGKLVYDCFSWTTSNPRRTIGLVPCVPSYTLSSPAFNRVTCGMSYFVVSPHTPPHKKFSRALSQAFKFVQTKNHKSFLCPIVCSKSWYTDGNVSNSGPLCLEFKCWTNYGTKHYSMTCCYSEEESGTGVFGIQIPL